MKDNTPSLEVREDGQIYVDGLLVSNQEVAHGIIWRNYASPKDRKYGNELKPGIYPIPDLKWEVKEELYCRQCGRKNCTACGVSVIWERNGHFKKKVAVISLTEKERVYKKVESINIPGIDESLKSVSEERKRLLIEMMQEDENNGMYDEPLDKFMDDEIAYLKSCNPVDRWGRIENKFAAGMIHAYERIKSEREYIAHRKQQSHETNKP